MTVLLKRAWSRHKDKFKISIITPSLNSAQYLEEAIESVLAQEYKNVEHVIVDGGSDDGTLEILKKYKHLIWVSEPDNGQSCAMNKGFRMSSGNIIGYLNADDYYLPDAFNTVIKYFKTGANFVVGKVKVIMEHGNGWICDPKVDHLDMLRHWEPQAFCVNPVGYFYKREIQVKVGGYNESNHHAMDLEFLLAASQNWKLTKVSENNELGVFRFFKGTKTDKLLNSMEWLSMESYSFIEEFLKKLPDDYVKQYKRDRIIGYEEKKIKQRRRNN